MNNLKQLITALLLLILPIISKSQNIYTIAGNGNQGYSGDGLSATSMYCELNTPSCLFIDSIGNIYFTDTDNDVVRKINSSGIISTFAGSHILGAGFSGDNGQATNAQLNIPYGLTIDKVGNIYIADYGNNAIRKINTTGVITTVAGIGVGGFSGDNNLATLAELNHPTSVFVDIPGNIYIGDCGNHRIRKINISGIITSIAGNGKGGYYADGGLADTSEINSPFDISMDKSGSLYFCDPAYDVERIRKINSSGFISTIAGNGIQGYSGNGGPATSAELYAPTSFSIDNSGNIYFTDQGNQRIRKIDTLGNITAIAGIGISGFSGEGGPASAAEFNFPVGIALDNSDNIYLVDQLNQRIRKISNLTGIKDTQANTNIAIYPNPTNQLLTINFYGQFVGPATLSIIDIRGREVFNSQF